MGDKNFWIYFLARIEVLPSNHSPNWKGVEKGFRPTIEVDGIDDLAFVGMVVECDAVIPRGSNGVVLIAMHSSRSDRLSPGMTFEFAPGIATGVVELVESVRPE